MKVKCIKKVLTGQELIDATQRRDVNQLEFPVTVGKEYQVMGIVFYKDTKCLHYLVDDYNLPDWCPDFLFDITNPALPGNWFTKNYNTRITHGDLISIIGFDELCTNDDYHDALMEREEWALKIYRYRKNELLKLSEVDEFIKQSKSHINIDFERWKLLELFDEERFEESEGQTIDYILRTDDNCIFTLYIAPFNGYAVITLKRADTSDVIFEIEIDKIHKIDCTETALLFYKKPDRKENDPADVIVTIKPKVRINLNKE